MNHRVMRLTLVAFCAPVFAGMLSQQPGAGSQGNDVTFSKDDQTTTIDCSRSAISVNGHDNKITIKGECRKLTIIGDDNQVKAAAVNEVLVSGDDNQIDVETVAKISVSGDDNKIAWKKGVGNKPPEISNTGDDNDIKQDD